LTACLTTSWTDHAVLIAIWTLALPRLLRAAE
jgi:hypothetical protein